MNNRGSNRLPSIIIVAAIASAYSTHSAHAQSAAELRDQMLTAHRDGNYREAVKIGKQLVELDPNNVSDLYNLACAYALYEKPIRAVKWLKKAAKAGFSDFTLVTNDPDLASIRTDPGYIEVVKLIRKNQDEGRGAFQERIANSEPIVYVPPGLSGTATAPLIVVLHGYGTTAEDIFLAWRDTAKEMQAILVAPRAIRAAGDSGGFEWGAIDEADMIVMAAIEKVKKQHRINPQRIVLSGFSQGGYMTFHIGLRRPEVFCGLIPIAGRYEQTVHSAAHARPAQLPKIYIMVGEDDYVFDNNKSAARSLEAAGFIVRLKTFPGVGHHLPPEHQEELRRALQFIWPN